MTLAVISLPFSLVHGDERAFTAAIFYFHQHIAQYIYLSQCNTLLALLFSARNFTIL
jgi:hypothetical protein